MLSIVPFEKSPLRLIDPSCGSPDSELCAELVAAIVGDRPLPDGRDLDGFGSAPAEPGNVYESAPPINSVSDAAFRERVATVSGWDALVVYQPYQHGDELPRSPAIESWWLQRQIDHTDGLPQESYLRVLVIRDQQSVGSIALYGELESSGVVTRSR